MEIKRSIVHRIEKMEKSTGPASTKVHCRDELLPIDDNLNKLCAEVLKLYGRVSNSYGKLGEKLEVDRFPNYLTDYCNEAIDFKAFSTLSADVLAEEMSDKIWATTSYPIFIDFTNQGRQWLLIAVMKLKTKVGINENTLDLNSALTFDVNDLREAARIDIAKWKSNTQPYLSFIKKGSGKDSETSEYFRKALSCLEYIDAKHNTDVALRAIDDFCDEKNFSSEKRRSVREKVHTYCKEKKDAGEPVVLSTVSALIYDEDPEEFALFVRSNNYEVSERFSPHSQSYNRYKRLSRRYGNINISFDVDDLATGKVDYDEEMSSILLSNPPDDLVAEIKKMKGQVSNSDE